MSNKELYGIKTIENDEGELIREFNFLYVLEKKEEQEIKENLKIINTFLELAEMMNDITESFNEINSVLENERNAREKISKLISNYLSKIRAYQDGMAHFLKENYKSSEDILKNALSHEYDNKFSYRYLNQLRNYLQHRGREAYSTLRAYYDDGKAKVKVYMNNKTFINEYPKMKAELRNELSLDLEADIDIIRQIKRMQVSMMTIHQKVINSCIDINLCKAIKHIYSYKEKYQEYEEITIMDKYNKETNMIENMELLNIRIVSELIKDIRIKVKR
ncbi:hypothetical protein NE398_21200 [Clostridium tertium]|uniref:Uncharacterized protein n=1 Tax=Clostridium tertium TaxID=1559 RepID=A0A9X3XNK7_9CLOT|nr:hypothetical protein [Clostridium tertium]MDC4242640.1 hypothetical protein [Clostridium tertium]